MKPLKEFDEFLVIGTVKKQASDKSRAKFLIREAELSFEGLNERIEKISINNKNANSIIKDCYDIFMELVRAKMLLDGYNASGQGAHEAEVSYMKKLNFNNNDIQFANQLRYFRNGMIYYGTILDEEYAKKVVEFLKKIYPKLKSLVQRKTSI